MAQILQAELHDVNMKLHARLLLSSALINMGKFQDGLVEAEKVYSQGGLYSKPLFELDAILNQYDALIRLSRTQEVQILNGLIESLILQIRRDDYTSAKIREARYFRLQGDFFFAKNDYKQALSQYQRSLDLSTEINDKSSIAWALNNIGNVLYYRSELTHAKDYYERSYLLRIETQIDIDIIKSLGNLGIIAYIEGRYDDALKYYNNALKIIIANSNEPNERNQSENKARFLSYIGMVHQDKGELDSALKYNEESLAIHEELQNKKERAFTLNNISKIHYLKGDFKQALECVNKSLLIKNELGDQKEIALAYTMIGNIQFAKGELEKAADAYEASYLIKDKIDFKVGLVDSLISLGEVYSEKESFNAAEEVYRKALALDTVHPVNPVNKAQIYYLLIRMYVLTKNMPKATECLKEFEKINNYDNNQVIIYRYAIAKAQIQAYNSDKATRVQILKDLRILANDMQINIYRPLLIDDLKDSMYLLIDELTEGDNSTVFIELNNIIQQLTIIAEKESLYPLITEIKIIQAKLQLINNIDIQKAEEILQLVQELATKKDLTRLSKRIRKEYTQLLQEKDKWLQYKQFNSSIKDRIALAQIRHSDS